MRDRKTKETHAPDEEADQTAPEARGQLGNGYPGGRPADLARQVEELYLKEELATARAETEAERLRYRGLVDLDPDAHIVSSKTGVISEANLAAARLLAVPARFLVNKPLVVYVKMEDRPALREAISAMAWQETAELMARFTPRAAPAWTGHVRLAALRETKGGPLSGIRWIVRDVTEAHQAQQQIAGNREQLRELTSELALAEERVRRDIAVGIHDRVSQPLALVRILLGKFKRSATQGQAAELDEVSALLQQAIEESRTLTFELSPPVLYELGLPAAVEWLAEQMQRRHGVQIRPHTDSFDRPIPIDVRVLLFQAIRELLTNIIKHASARHADITLRSNGEMVEAIVLDDGVGARNSNSSQRPAPAGGFGLFSIRTRVERLGGRFEFQSTRRRGTKVTLIVPIAQEDAKAAAGEKGMEKGQEPGK